MKTMSLNFKIIKKNKNIRMIQFRASSGLCDVFEIQRKRWYRKKWKTLSFHPIDDKNGSWFVDKEIANECYNRTISAC